MRYFPSLFFASSRKKSERENDKIYQEKKKRERQTFIHM